jgi:tripartite-type tricarboxylate transporter receptor subunit TctC
MKLSRKLALLNAARRSLVLAAVVGTVAMAAAPIAQAQPLSNRPIRMVVVGTPGATADILGRVVADSLSKSLGQPVIVEPKPGAGGAVAMEYFLRAPADGHTYLLAVSSLVSELPHTFKPKYDPFTAIKPLVDLGGTGALLVGNASLPPKSFQEMVAYVKANKGKLNIGSFSPGGMSHILGLQLNQLAGLDLNIVQYNGSSPGLVDVVGGSVQYMMDVPFTSVPMIKSGKLRAFAVSSPKRSEVLPDVPTFAELGLEPMTRVSWMGLWTLPGVPDAVQQRVRGETLKALQTPEIRERLANLGLGVDSQNPRTPEELSKTLKLEYKITGETLQAVGYKPQ